MAIIEYEYRCSPESGSDYMYNTYGNAHACLYRAHSSGKAGRDGKLVVFYEKYYIASYTPRGVKVHTAKADKLRFVNLRAGRQFAAATKEEALWQLYDRGCQKVGKLKRQIIGTEQQLRTLLQAFIDREG